MARAGDIMVLPKIHGPAATIRYALPVSKFALSTLPVCPFVASTSKPAMSSVGARLVGHDPRYRTYARIRFPEQLPAVVCLVACAFASVISGHDYL